MTKLDSKWKKTLELLRSELNPTQYETWIAPLQPKEVDEKQKILYLEADKEIVIDRLNDRYLQLLQGAVNITFDGSFKVIGSVAEPSTPQVSAPIEQTDSGFLQLDEEYYVNPTFSFANFVVGKTNEFAYNAALAVAEAPAKNFNPLFLYGGSGLGKTHLMCAIGRYVLETHKKKKVLYVSAEMFTNELINSLRGKNSNAFRKKYRNVDVLLIDDIQFIEGKAATEEEFFHTFTYLHDHNKQIVISSDRPPKSFTELDDRLVSRFLWNVTADIQPPDFETRVAILQSKAALENVELTDDVLQIINLIAEKITDNIREMEGALTRICAFSELMNKPLNLALAREVLKDIIIYSDKPITVENIKRVVARYYSVTIKDIDSSKRSRNLAFPRQVAMYLCKELTGSSLPQIGKSFGDKDHTTVLHAVKKIASLLENDSSLQDDIDQLTVEIGKL